MNDPYANYSDVGSAPAAPEPLRQRLEHGIAELQVDVADSAIDSLVTLALELMRWSKAINLTALREPAQVIDLHLLDSLTIAPFVTGLNVLDVGTGAGLPGLPLAILQPDRQFILLDSASKKLRFIDQMIMQLKLKNVSTVHARIEKFQPPAPIDCILTRAFAPLPRMLEGCGHLMQSNGPTGNGHGGSRLLAMKGVWPADELESLPAGYTVNAITPLRVPGVDAERHLIEIVYNPVS